MIINEEDYQIEYKLNWNNNNKAIITIHDSLATVVAYKQTKKNVNKSFDLNLN